MALALADSNYKTFTSFANDLDRYQQDCNVFFDYGLLDLLSDHFACYNCGITAYDQLRYIGCIGRHRAEGLAAYHLRDFYKRDQLSKFITQERHNLSIPIVRATDLIPADVYSQSEYAAFLRSAGLQYVAVMVFPQYRICMYKEAAEGDFSNQEVEIISCLHSLIDQKRKNHLAVKEQAVASRSKSIFMDNLQIGFIVFDERGAAVEYNQTALCYLKTLFSSNSLHTAFADILDVMDIAGNPQGEAVTRQYRGFTINLTPVMSVDSFGLVKTCYSISISRTSNRAVGKYQNAGLQRQFASLTARELEVLDAYCEGDDYGQIAKELFISENTVRSHLKSIYRKLDVTNQRALIKRYCQYNMPQSQ